MLSHLITFASFEREHPPPAEPAFRARVTRKASTVGARVRALRLASGRTAMEVAVAAGMARSNFARLEASRHEPRLATLRRVAEALAVPHDALVE